MQDRTSEWFVPKIGPRNFRIGVGMLFLPYTMIVTCFAIWGSLGGVFVLDRLVAIGVIYFLAVGVSAHCLDAVGGKTKPWGDLPKRKIVSIAISSLVVVFTIGFYYAFLDSPLLIPIGIAEGFFLFAYNLELFGGKFHNNLSTIISWGVLPVFAGSAIQSNSISIETILLSIISASITYLLITTSRKYKHLKREGGNIDKIKNKERILKLITLTVIVVTISFFIVKI
ncbi:hypothetical protein Nlim_0957 [Candidatus Nitrosarchaeum limnium SFB1]|jgi:hypothetical protein|uniref:UbiA prenyltransferase n=1 Tax=Candidatus Nitrosarchaeum limnium SFB1 TaxID=886738 RepID=F3KKE2_9ARCH|nr:hypothetical protein Nlim_0957 [Candidatus Nitrosarchaeum limnium SFB1]